MNNHSAIGGNPSGNAVLTRWHTHTVGYADSR